MRLVKAHYGNIISKTRDTSPELSTLQFEPSHRLGLFLANWGYSAYLMCSRGLYLVTDEGSASEAVHDIPDGDEAYSSLAALNPDGYRYFTDRIHDWALSTGEGEGPNARPYSDPSRIIEVFPFNMMD